ncbi:unnamed protein product [Phaedon cochleariae]|uniref:Ionotropic receptor n=1 Tax=Phaedon cochleariae TaxID=80249 RepID=A0A9P0DI54_PHACE|nr:unnamed protein product [Phaedon cochleariae]
MCFAIKMALWIEYTFFNYNVKYSFVTVVVTAISIFAQQGSHILPKQIGGRLIFLNLLVLSILLYNYYTSSLVSSLLSSKPYSFTTIEELVESNLRAGIEFTPYAITYILQQQDDDAVRRLNSTKLYETGKPNYFSPRDGIALVKKGGFAYHTDAIRAYPLIAMTYEDDIICDLAQIDFVTPGYLGFMLQKNSQYSELMKISLTKMLSSGILDREKKFWNPRKPECVLSARVVAVGMKELALVYVIIVAGMVTSLLTLAVEMIWFRLLDNEDKYSRRKQFNSVTTFLSYQGDNDWLNGYNDNSPGYVLDTTCEAYKEILVNSSKRGKFRFTHRWLIIHHGNKSDYRTEIRDIFSGVELRADMDMHVAFSISSNHYNIFEIFKLGTGVDTTINRIGQFLEGTLHYCRNMLSFYESRKNLSGVLLRSGSTTNYSLETEDKFAEEYRNIKHKIFEKFDFISFLNLRSTHHFSYNLTLASAWYGNSSSGIDGGVAKLLHEKTLDISSAGGILRVGRMEFYDYLLPYFEFRTCYFFKNPGTLKPGTEVLKPFSLNTWYAVSGLALLISAAIKFAYFSANRFLNSNTRTSFFTSFLITISILAQQGSAMLPAHLGGRLIFMNLLILSILLYNYYTSSLVSSLLSSKPKVMSTVRELSESNLKKNDAFIQKLNRTKIYESGKPNFMSPEEGIAMVKKGGFAYHTDGETAYPLVARTFDQESICDLAEIDFVTPGVVGLSLQKRSEYTELFQISLTMMRVGGILKRDKDFWLPRKPECLLGSRVVSVGVNELFLVYLILFTGIIISLFILVIETVCFWWTNRNNVFNSFVN